MTIEIIVAYSMLRLTPVSAASFTVLLLLFVQSFFVAKSSEAGAPTFSKPRFTSWVLIKMEGYQFNTHIRNSQFAQFTFNSMLLLTYS